MFWVFPACVNGIGCGINGRKRASLSLSAFIKFSIRKPVCLLDLVESRQPASERFAQDPEADPEWAAINQPNN